MNRALPPEARPILPNALRRPVVIVSVLAALAVLAVAVIVAGDHRPTTFDRAVRSRLEISTTTESRWALAVDRMGEPIGLAVLVALLVGLSLLLRRPRMAVLSLVGIGLTVSATSTLKPVVGRTIHDVYLSYPSGHTASATAAAMTAALLVWHRLSRGAALALLYGVASVIGAAAAWAQSSLMAHYPSDTLGGWCTALAVVPTTAWLVDHAAVRWSARQGATRGHGPGPLRKRPDHPRPG